MRRESRSYNFRRNPSDNGVSRHILRHNGSGCNYCPISNFHTTKNSYIGTDPNIVSYYNRRLVAE